MEPVFQLIRKTDEGYVLNSLDRPTSATYDLTKNCNLRCRFCYQGELPQEKEESSFETACKILDEMQRSGVEKVVFVGGEPFLYPHWERTLVYAGRIGLKSSFVSNGTLITPETVGRIAGLISEGLISIHGDERIHDSITSVRGSYRKAVDGLKLLFSGGVKTGLYYTLTADNHSKISAAVSALIDDCRADFTWLAINRDLPLGMGTTDYFSHALTLKDYSGVFEQIEQIQTAYDRPVFLEISLPFCLVEERYHRYILTCRTGISHTAVDPAGNMKLCPVANENMLGNILKDGLLNLWQNSPVLARYRSLAWLPEPCGDCGYLNRCLGGCYIASQAKRKLARAHAENNGVDSLL